MRDDMARVYTVTLFLLKSGYPYVSVVDGGWGACVRYVLEEGLEDVLEDWEEESCMWWKYESTRERAGSGGGKLLAGNIFGSRGGEDVMEGIKGVGAGIGGAAVDVKEGLGRFGDSVSKAFESATASKRGGGGVGATGDERKSSLNSSLNALNFGSTGGGALSGLSGMGSPLDALKKFSQREQKSEEIVFDEGEEPPPLLQLQPDFSIGDDNVEE